MVARSRPSPAHGIELCFFVCAFFSNHVFGSTGASEAASTVVSAHSSAGGKLFEFERIQVTADVLADIAAQDKENDILALVGFDHTTASNQSYPCKSIPGDQTYPLPGQWELFDRLLGGALIKTVPIAAPCYQSSGVYDAAKCADISARFTTGDVHTSDPTSMMWPIFQGRTCMPTNDSSKTCTLGGFPSYSIRIENVAQIQLGINFARNNNLRLVIKNTGHDYIGKSGGADALSLWTHNLKDIEFIEKYDSPEYNGPAFKAGAGVQGFEILEAARDHGVTVLAGICETVGWAGGYLTGGGHNPLASIYGMSADSVLAYEVVTANGSFVTATSTVNSDLFWALRGGGGSTYGVITSVIAKAHPKIHVTKSAFSFQASPENSEAFWRGAHAWFKFFPEFSNAGGYGYFWIWNYGTQLDFQVTALFAPNHTIDSFNELTKPLFDELKALNISMAPNTTFHDDFYSANKGAWGVDFLGVATIRQATRIFPKSLWDTPAKLNAFVEAVKTTSMTGHAVGGFNMAPGNPFNVDNAVNPAWRSSQSFLITGNQVPDGASPAELKLASDDLTFNVMDPWRKIAPNSEGGGVYLNEADIQEPNWQADFYGAKNYPRLLSIKRKWDPNDVFYATTAVGSERWEVRDGEQGVQTQNGRLCRV